MTKNTATLLQLSCLAHRLDGLSDDMTGLIVLDAFVADPAAAEAKRAPEWIMVTPRGKFTARDGRQFEVDPEALAARFVREKIDLAVDIDHATVKKAALGNKADAVGWISELQARADGLYGKVEWLEEGLRVLSARTHRYISPTLTHDAKGKADWLHSVALVATPAACMPAVASADITIKTENDMSIKAIANALGLSTDAAETSCLSAIDVLKARVDLTIHQAALDQVATLTTELNGIKASARQGKVDALFEGALRAKKITPAQAEQYKTLCATDDGLKTVTALFETLGTGLGATDLDKKQAKQGDLVTLSALDREMIKEMGLTEEDYRKANGLVAA